MCIRDTLWLPYQGGCPPCVHWIHVPFSLPLGPKTRQERSEACLLYTSLSGVRVLGLEDRHLLLDFLLNFGRADDLDLALVDELRQLGCALRLDVVVRLGVNG